MKKTLMGIIALALLAVFGNAAVAVAAPVAGHKIEHRAAHRKVVHKRIVHRRIVHRRVVKKVAHNRVMDHGKK
ncbi:MAG: hypothetical protein M0Z84_11190 [Gammaproteobacteria bacterium]|nr:hypothetical protein [Gammaproteobacteria bacterium]